MAVRPGTGHAGAEFHCDQRTTIPDNKGDTLHCRENTEQSKGNAPWSQVTHLFCAHDKVVHVHRSRGDRIRATRSADKLPIEEPRDVLEDIEPWARRGRVRRAVAAPTVRPWAHGDVTVPRWQLCMEARR